MIPRYVGGIWRINIWSGGCWASLGFPSGIQQAYSLGAYFCRLSYFFPLNSWEAKLCYWLSKPGNGIHQYFFIPAAFWLVCVYVALELFLPVVWTNIIATYMNLNLLFSHFRCTCSYIPGGLKWRWSHAWLGSSIPTMRWQSPWAAHRAVHAGMAGSPSNAEFKVSFTSIIFCCVQGDWWLPNLTMP